MVNHCDDSCEKNKCIKCKKYEEIPLLTIDDENPPVSKNINKKKRRIMRNYDETEKTTSKKIKSNNVDDDDEKTDDQQENNEIPIEIDILTLLRGTGCRNEENEDETEKLKKKIMNSDVPDEIKQKLISRLPKNRDVREKISQIIETVLQIPYNKSIPPIKVKESSLMKTYFDSIKNCMNRAVYGLNNVKNEIIEHVAQTITSKNKKNIRVLALKGHFGVGKTKLVRNGISHALNRPMKYFSLCGLKDASHFYGFEESYHSSKHGLIVQSLIESKVNNPIFFFDELDKLSASDNGDEIMNVLMQITDPVQNHDFRDKFLSEFPIDLSKVLFIFAYNDESRINPILLDRLHIVNVESPSFEDKVIITNKYLIPEVSYNIGIDSEYFEFSEEMIRYIILNFADKEGVRNLKKCIESILLKINYWRLIGEIPKQCTLKKFPIILNTNVIDLCLKNHVNESSSNIISMYS